MEYNSYGTRGALHVSKIPIRGLLYWYGTQVTLHVALACITWTESVCVGQSDTCQEVVGS